MYLDRRHPLPNQFVLKLSVELRELKQTVSDIFQMI